MASLYDTLKASKSQRFPDYWTLLWGRKLSASMIKTITGTLPLTVTAKGGNAVDWTIYGNAEGVGERTKNLLKITTESQTINGVTFTVDKVAGTITVNGTAQSVVQLHLRIGAPSGNYYFSGCTSGGSSRTYYVVAWDNSVLGRAKQWDGVTNSLNDYGAESNEIKVDSEHSMQLTITIMSGYTANNLVFKPMIRLPDTTPEFSPYGYQIPLTVSQTGQTDKNYDIFIGSAPLGEGESVSKSSTGIDIELFEGENTVSTTLTNKPEMTIRYK